MLRPVVLLGALVALVLVGSITPVAGTATAIVVTDADGTELLAVPVADGEEVTIEYVHSVERSLVSDVYVVDDGAFVAERMLFSSYGAGLPSEASVTRVGDRYVYHPPAERFETLTISTGPIASHELVVDGTRYELAGLTEDGAVQLRIETRRGG